MSDIQERIMDQLQLWFDSIRVADPYANSIDLCMIVCSQANKLVAAIENNTVLYGDYYWSDNAVTFYILFGNQPIVLLRQCINDFMLQ